MSCGFFDPLREMSDKRLFFFFFVFFFFLNLITFSNVYGAAAERTEMSINTNCFRVLLSHFRESVGAAIEIDTSFKTLTSKHL